MKMARTGCLLAMLASTNSPAELLPRGMYDGVALVYDSDLDVTWVADANLAGTLAGNDGLRDWEAARAWAAGLTIAGLSDWRLPRIAQPDPSCANQEASFTGFPIQGNGLGCTGSEMGHLYYVSGITHETPGPFLNVPPRPYGHWSGTEFAPAPASAWAFSFGSGGQGAFEKGSLGRAWAVRSGDVAVDAVAVRCHIETDRLLYTVGDTLTLGSYQLVNPGAESVAVELKAWMVTPLNVLTITNVGADGAAVLPPGLDIELGPIAIFTVSAGMPSGVYTIGCRLLDPVTGAELAVEQHAFEVR